MTTGAPPGAGADPGGPAREPAADVDGVFGALADPTRRRLLQLLAARHPSSATALAGQVTVSRQAVVQHLAVLERSRLVSSRRVGREVLFSVRPESLTATASWMTALAETWDERLRLLKQRAESDPPA
ncbi:ArsR/SmtB family transcription factor [Streptomyces sp. CA-111067]|uniref:ArsR/SmtB family transcription factor n=1 Tax=Streptomyces sp. CA-111067 TaxID=3240046 RepID=UPI003D968E13